MKIYNTLTRKKEEFKPLNPPVVTMYNCGPTVYNYAHIGNLSAYLMADLIRRVLEYFGYDVKHVKNITDVGHMTNDDEDAGEDKMEKAAREKKKDPYEIARYYEEEFLKDEKKLRIKPAHHFPRATEHVKEMIVMIEKMIQDEVAYVTEDGVYFDITKFSNYGKLSGNTLEDLLAGARIQINTNKRNPVDFALWKLNQPNHIMQWDSPWGTGYPGWHIECSAMSTKYLGESIDIHTGGVDNIFPHHECEIAQSETAFKKPFVNYWIHKGYLNVEGEKMSKSKGNFYTLRDIEEKGYDPVLFRYLVLSAHYRSPVNFSFKGLDEARAAIERLQDFYDYIQRLPEVDEENNHVAVYFERLTDGFSDSLQDDLNTPEALSYVFTFIKDMYKLRLESISETNKGRILEFFTAFNDIFDVLDISEGKKDELSGEIEDLMNKREEARKNKDFATADTLRDEIESKGVVLIDTAKGTDWRWKA